MKKALASPSSFIQIWDRCCKYKLNENSECVGHNTGKSDFYRRVYAQPMFYF